MTSTAGTDRLKILFVIPGVGGGGQERQLTELASGLVQRGHTVDVAINHEGGLYQPILTDAGARVIVLHETDRNTEGVGMPTRMMLAARRLLSLSRLIHRERYDIVHGYGDSSNLYATLASRPRRRHGLIWGVRASDQTGNAISASMIPLLSRRADLVIANSRAGAQFVRDIGCRPKDIEVIPNGIDVNRCTIDPVARIDIRSHLGLADDERLIGIIGNFHPRKGISIFLEAMAKLEPALKCRFLVLGGDYWGNRKDLDAKVAALDIADRVIFHGNVTDAERWMNALDVLVSASYTEGFSNVLAEGMACGVPCVATDVGDSRAIVGDFGYMIAPGDADAMAAAVTKTLRQPRADRATTRAAITSAFTIPHLIDRSEAAFVRALART